MTDQEIKRNRTETIQNLVARENERPVAESIQAGDFRKAAAQVRYFNLMEQLRIRRQAEGK